MTPIQDDIFHRLQTFEPVYLQIVNESMNHAGYFDGKESHFKVTLVSEVFIDKRLATRHQLLYQELEELLTSGGGTVHALALHTYTPTEWQILSDSPKSPNCAGQNK